jgi:hypothetical protein
MTRDTYNIIRACKGNFLTDETSEIKRVKLYMAKVCDTPVERYTDNIISSIMLNALYDYIDTCDRPSAFLRSMYSQVGDTPKTLAERIAIAFQLVRIKNENGEYVNGFKPEFFETVSENNEEESKKAAIKNTTANAIKSAIENLADENLGENLEENKEDDNEEDT